MRRAWLKVGYYGTPSLDVHFNLAWLPVVLWQIIEQYCEPTQLHPDLIQKQLLTSQGHTTDTNDDGRISGTIHFPCPFVQLVFQLQYDCLCLTFQLTLPSDWVNNKVRLRGLHTNIPDLLHIWTLIVGRFDYLQQHIKENDENYKLIRHLSDHSQLLQKHFHDLLMPYYYYRRHHNHSDQHVKVCGLQLLRILLSRQNRKAVFAWVAQLKSSDEVGNKIRMELVKGRSGIVVPMEQWR